MSSVAIGIDLGTTFSVVAYVNKYNSPEIVPNEEGQMITSSVIFFDKDQIIVGADAERSGVAHPEQVVQFVKRNMGNPDYTFNYGGKDWNAIELSAQILKALVRSASKKLKQEITEAVITVPAYFGQNERKATIQAAEAAGLKVLKIINEPTAAAIAYGLNQVHAVNRCLVFDLGGGTFDVTTIEINGDDVRVKSTGGDDQLGGKDWDDRLMKYVAEAFKEKHGLDIMSSALSRHQLRETCLQAKLSLTQRPEVSITFRHENKPLRLKITRENFEGLTADLLARCEETTLTVLQESGFSAEQIDTILLVGGSTRMPMVRNRIKDIFKKDPETNINPDECVALGAAISASIEFARARQQKPPVDIKTYDVAGHQLGLVVLKEDRLYNASIIKKNTPIPCEETNEQFVTLHEGQPIIDLWLVQGESKDPLDKTCNILGHFEFFGIPMQQENKNVAITYRYNANGIVEVEASDPTSKTKYSHRLAKDKYTLRDVIAGKIPANIAFIIDSSGSMYGKPLQEAAAFIERFASKNLRNNRSIAIYTNPDGLVGKPTNDIGELRSNLNSLTPIGYSTLHTELRRAKEHLKGRGGIYIIITDGHTHFSPEIKKYCEKIHRSGGKLFVVAVGDDCSIEQLEEFVASPKNILKGSSELNFSQHLINLIKHL